MRHVPTRIDLIRELPLGAQLAEVGVDKGHFSIEILNTCPRLGKLWLVDSWQPYVGYEDTVTAEDQEKNMAECLQCIRGHVAGGRVEVIRGLSLDVAGNNYHMPPLDAVYLDANHGEDCVYHDLRMWSMRLKPNGVILGHDYCDNETARRLNFGVIPAVTRFCKDFGWELSALTEEEYPSFRLDRFPNWTGADL